MLNLKELIRPSADLRNHYNEISRQCREENTAVIITVNGRGDTVSLGYEEYKRLQARIELLEILAEADEDVKYGRTAPVKETFDDAGYGLLCGLAYEILVAGVQTNAYRGAIEEGIFHVDGGGGIVANEEGEVGFEPGEFPTVEAHIDGSR